MDTLKEFREQSDQELQAMGQDLLKDIFNLRNEIKMTRSIEKPHLLRKKKRDRARILTLLRQREKGLNS